MPAYQIRDVSWESTVVFAASESEAGSMYVKFESQVLNNDAQVESITLLDGSDRYNLFWEPEFDPDKQYDEHTAAVLRKVRLTLDEWEAALGSGMFAFEHPGMPGHGLCRFAWKKSRQLS
jgi:hypothetical protein